MTPTAKFDARLLSETGEAGVFALSPQMPKSKITETDLCRAAKRLRTSTAEVETVAEVESAGNAYYSDGFPVILFERHKFHKFTGGKFAKDHPRISQATGGGYSPPKGMKNEDWQRSKFNEAAGLDIEAAQKSCSWGKFQLMGFNYEVCGFDSVGDFVVAMNESEGRQLDAFVEFVIHSGLGDELRSHDWKGFARGYNGAGYKQNNYDTKLANAYEKFKKRKIHCNGQDSTAASITNPLQHTENHNKVGESNSAEQPSINSETKVEVSAEGGVKVEKTEGAPGPKERVAVVKGSKKRWTSAVWAKIVGIITGSAVFQWTWGQLEKIQDLQVPSNVWIIVSITGAIGTVLWIVHTIVDTWRANRNQERVDQLLVEQNSTADNLVQLIPADEVDLYRLRGYKIITRGDAGVPLRALTEEEKA